MNAETLGAIGLPAGNYDFAEDQAMRHAGIQITRQEFRMEQGAHVGDLILHLSAPPDEFWSEIFLDFMSRNRPPFYRAADVQADSITIRCPEAECGNQTRYVAAMVLATNEEYIGRQHGMRQP